MKNNKWVKSVTEWRPLEEQDEEVGQGENGETILKKRVESAGSKKFKIEEDGGGSGGNLPAVTRELIMMVMISLTCTTKGVINFSDTNHRRLLM